MDQNQNGYPGARGGHPGNQGGHPGGQGHPGAQGAYPGGLPGYPGGQGGFPQGGFPGAQPAGFPQAFPNGGYQGQHGGYPGGGGVPPKKSNGAAVAVGIVVAVLLLGGLGWGVFALTGDDSPDTASPAAAGATTSSSAAPGSSSASPTTRRSSTSATPRGDWSSIKAGSCVKATTVAGQMELTEGACDPTKTNFLVGKVVVDGTCEAAYTTVWRAEGAERTDYCLIPNLVIGECYDTGAGPLDVPVAQPCTGADANLRKVTEFVKDTQDHSKCNVQGAYSYFTFPQPQLVICLVKP